MRRTIPWALLLAGVAGAQASGSAEDRLLDTLRVLSGEVPLDGAPIRSRHVLHPDHDRAHAWLRAELEGIDGLDVVEEPFEAAGVPVANLVASRPGTDPGAPTIVIGAHLDSIASRTEGWEAAVDPAPGADDDASGVAAVLELARRLEGVALTHPVRFVLFDAEELGLLGSEVHAPTYAEGEVAWMLSLDPIGHDPGGAGYLWLSHDPRWPELAQAFVETGAAIGTRLVLQPVDGSLLGANSQRSDHAPFWDAGHPALHVASFPQPPDYHTVTDTLAVVDPSFTAAVVDLVEARILEEAAVDATPPRSSKSETRGGCGG